MKPTFPVDLSVMYCRYVDVCVTENGLVATTVATIKGTSLPPAIPQAVSTEMQDREINCSKYRSEHTVIAKHASR